MSILSSAVLFLLCLSFHASNARRLCVMNTEPEKGFHLSSKNNENKISVTSSKQLEVAEKESMIVKENKVDEGEGALIDKEAATQRDLIDQRGRTRGSSVVETKPIVSVSWRVPQKKNSGQQQPGFNLDYSPPKTHPPVHN